MHAEDVVPEEDATAKWLRLIALAVAVASAFAAIGMALPVLPLVLKRSLGASDATIGLVMGVHAAIAVVGRPAAGAIISRRGARRVLIAGGVLIGVGSAMYLVAGRIALVVASRLIIGAGDACAMIAGAAWAITLGPTHQRGRVLGLFGLASWLGLTIGPAIGAALNGMGGPDAVWVASAVLGMAGALTAACLTSPARAVTRSTRFSAIPRQVLGPGLSLALSSAGYALLPAFIVLLLTERGSSAGPAVLTLAGAAFILTRIALSQPIDRWNPRRVAATGTMVEALGLVIIAGSKHVGAPVLGPFVGAVIAGAGTSVVYPSLALLALHGIADAEAANALGAFTGCWDAGLASGAALIGVLSTHWGYDGGCYGAAALAILSGVISSIASRRRVRSESGDNIDPSHEPR